VRARDPQRASGDPAPWLLKPVIGSDEYTGMPSDAISDTARAEVPTPLARVREKPVVLPIRRLTDWLEARAMFVIAVSVVLIVSLLGIPRHLSQDSWLAMVAGRVVAAHGVPQHDYFSYLTHGARWVDQQWLAQLLMYEVEHVGGLPLLCVLYVMITVAAFGGAVAAARRLGAEDLHVLEATLPGAFFYLVTALSIRTQGLAYPLFVTTLWLLASDLRSPVRQRRVYWVFPILMLWGNLHGSVTLGAGLAVLYGLVLLLGGVRRDGVRGLGDVRALAFIVLSPLTLIVTPYGTGMVHYYRVTLLNPEFSRMVTEWKPVLSVPVLAVPLFIVIGLTFAAIVRVVIKTRAGKTSNPGLFDTLALLALAIGAVTAVRNVTWFGLALVVLLPRILTQLKGGAPAPLRRARSNRMIALATLALAALMTLAILGRPTSWFTSTYPTQTIPTLRKLIARDPHAKLLADVRYADWLIWEDPQLFSGRVAYDTSFELLNTSQLSAISDLAAKTPYARHMLGEFRIWMLYPGNHSVNRTLLHRPGVRVVSRSHTVIIATHAFPSSA
jgi:hypothetical protein